jgi:hypothetical protein
MYNQSVVIGNTPQDIKWRLSEKKGYKGRYLAKKRGARGVNVMCPDLNRPSKVPCSQNIGMTNKGF